MIDILNFLEDAGDVLDGTIAAVPGGSYLALMQPVRDERLAAAARRWNALAASPVFLRDPAQVGRWLAGLELIEPGLVELQDWRPGPGDPACPGGVPLLGAVARKPA
jgi:hypothetical protein